MFDDWDFHIIGPIDALPRRRNIIAHGLCQFADTVPFLRHADVGLHCLEEGPGVEAFADSLKVVQYTYCCLPIVAPECLRSDRTHVFCYRPKDPESIRKALQAARAYDRTKIDPATVPSWDDVAAKCWE